MRKMTLVLLGIVMFGFISCSVFQRFNADVPDSIGFAIPSTLYDTKATETNGPAYIVLKDLVFLGKEVTDGINELLTIIGANEEFFIASMGIEVSVDSGEWFFFDQGNDADYYYIYYGSATGTTNFYMDWSQADEGQYSGKVNFFSDGDPDFEESLVYFDNTVAQPYLDIYGKTTASNNIDQFRVKLLEVASGEVKVFAKTVLDEPEDVFVMGWDIIGYGKEGSAGGGYGMAAGVLTNDVDFAPDEYVFSDYVYKEYFNEIGSSLNVEWSANFENTTAGTNGSYTEVVYDVDPVPTEVQTILDSMAVLTSAEYPTVTLP